MVSLHLHVHGISHVLISFNSIYVLSAHYNAQTCNTPALWLVSVKFWLWFNLMICWFYLSCLFYLDSDLADMMVLVLGYLLNVWIHVSSLLCNARQSWWSLSFLKAAFVLCSCSPEFIQILPFFLIHLVFVGFDCPLKYFMIFFCCFCTN